MKTVWVCEICGAKFDDEQECIEHEKICDPMITYTCDKCGKVESYRYDEQIHSVWHHINLGMVDRYDSKLTDRIVQFDLCDSCLFEYINSFKHKERILTSNEEKWDVRYGLQE